MILPNHATKEETLLLEHISTFLLPASPDDPVHVTFIKTPHELIVERTGDQAQISYGDLRMLARGLGILHTRKEQKYTSQETPRFDRLTLMLDCSRNAVPSLPFLKSLAVRLAIMGYNAIQLYTEDTFEVEGYSYFGYMRGRYSKEELRDFDSFCQEIGIELIPCIQTLAHLGGALRWDTFSEVKDIEDILLAGEHKTYALIEAMIRSCAQAFKSRTIHIGMDEAHLVGLGAYLKKHGYEERNTILCRHLERVIEICKSYGFEPMMWSDMFFRLASKKGDYYSDDSQIPETVIRMVPKEVSLVYWDYYSTEKETYDRMLDKHNLFDNPVIFAGGAWKWRGFAPSNEFSLSIAQKALTSCAEHGIRDVLLTAWGDNGAEASHLTILPSMLYYAEFCFGHDLSDTALSDRFKACTGSDWNDYMLMDLPNTLPDEGCNGRDNPSKYFLYQDVMCPLFDRHTKPSYTDYYARCTALLTDSIIRNPDFGYIFETLSALCRLLEKKVNLGVRIYEAYRQKDMDTLDQLWQKDIPAAAALAEEFRQTAYRQWMKENKPFGWEALDIRLGGVATRLHSAAARIASYRKGEVPELAELTESRLYYDCREEKEWETLAVAPGCWHEIVTACKMLL